MWLQTGHKQIGYSVCQTVRTIGFCRETLALTTPEKYYTILRVKYSQNCSYKKECIYTVNLTLYSISSTRGFEATPFIRLDSTSPDPTGLEQKSINFNQWNLLFCSNSVGYGEVEISLNIILVITKLEKLIFCRIFKFLCNRYFVAWQDFKTEHIYLQ